MMNLQVIPSSGKAETQYNLAIPHPKNGEGGLRIAVNEKEFRYE